MEADLTSAATDSPLGCCSGSQDRGSDCSDLMIIESDLHTTITKY